MGQTVFKSKLLIAVTFILLLTLSNFYLLTGMNTSNDPLTNDHWSQMVDELSHQAMILEDHRLNLSFLYKPFRLNVGVFRFARSEYQVFRVFIDRQLILKVMGLFFLIYYQLSRTSSESAPYRYHDQHER